MQDSVKQSDYNCLFKDKNSEYKISRMKVLKVVLFYGAKKPIASRAAIEKFKLFW